ncbi:MAG: reverse transcriptase domain-containing protein [Gammaproteobacteria bacterium]|nr:reverse transcriptase domain-containing protein [Gammaproteobacteria bacterium]
MEHRAVLRPYLQGLDELMSEAGHDGRYVRFADDFVALCRTQQEAEAVLAKIQAGVEQNGLSLHPDKTQVGYCLAKGQGFEFLGYRFEAGRRWVRPKSLKALKEKIRQKTGRSRSGSLETIVTELNPILKGWFGYFKHAYRSTFRTLDGYVRRRLRAILRRREKRPSYGRSECDHRRWPNTFFAKHGLFTMSEAHVLASQSR